MATSTPVRIRMATYKRLARIARQNRTTVVEMVDVVTRGWMLLSPEQQQRSIQVDVPLPSGKPAAAEC